MTIVEKFSAAFTGPDVGKLPILTSADSLLPNNGALLLLDPASRYGAWPAGAAAGMVVPNLAGAQARALIPTGDLNLSLTVGPTWASNGAVVERTAKGGLHFITPRATPGTNTTTAYLENNPALATYIRAASAAGDRFFVATWGQWTRPATALIPHASFGTNVAAFYSRPDVGTSEYPNSAAVLSRYRENAAPAAVGPFMQSSEVKPGTISAYSQVIPVIGGNLLASSERYGMTASQIFYGCYVENLTVSGRTYTEVRDLVNARYTADVKTVGGKYQGDTFTSPTTVP